MRRFAGVLPLPSLVALVVGATGVAACSDVAPGTQAQTSSGARDEATTPDPAVAADTTAGTIPASFHGVWDVMDNMGSCEEWSDMRLEIAPRQITFHESSGDVTKVSDKGDVVMIEVSGEAEGESFTDSFGLKLDDKGQLVIVDPDGPPWGEVYPRGRCPA